MTCRLVIVNTLSEPMLIYWPPASMKLEGGYTALQWCHNEHDGVSNHWRIRCLLNSLFSHRSKKTSKLHVIGLCACCEGNSPVTSEFPAQRTLNVKMFQFDDVIMLVSPCPFVAVWWWVLWFYVGQQWWWAVVVLMLPIEDQLDCCYCGGGQL